MKLKTVIVKDHEEATLIQYVCDFLYLIGLILLYSFRIRGVKLTLLLAYEFFMSVFPVNVF